jgi:predicted ATP-grasp superfamily ATP-dependent carboligase
LRARNSPKFAIISACARPYVTAAAQAGYSVAAFDIFNDVDTRRCCFYSSHVKFSDGGFDADDLLRRLSECDLGDASILYGSGLEGQPEVLAQIASRYNLLGNSADVVADIKNPPHFFQLLDRLSIQHPETVFDVPADTAGWLVKSGGGSGGTHIRRYDGRTGDYYQQEVAGLPVSLLFLADGSNIEVVGYNEQLLAPTVSMPFRYGGVVGNADLPCNAKTIMVEAAEKVTAAVGLRGLNSMDFVLSEQGPLALEINPRLSASFELYDIPDLLDRHMQACQGRLMSLPHRLSGAMACLIHYAEHDVLVPKDVVWPDWAVDLPSADSRICAGEPICSVLASAETAALAKDLAFASARQLMHNVRLLDLNSETV